MSCPVAIGRWRREQRQRLRLGRMTLPMTERSAFTAQIVTYLKQNPRLTDALIGFYWPFRNEVDLCNFVSEQIGHDGQAALPVVVEKNKPVEFWLWRPGDTLTPGVWNIPIPTKRRPVRPDILLVPLLGFDAAGYRLGNGGGYYDRTLAAMAALPYTVGVGYELGRLSTIYPCSHDVPMNEIVTEAGATRCRAHTDTWESH